MNLLTGFSAFFHVNLCCYFSLFVFMFVVIRFFLWNKKWFWNFKIVSIVQMLVLNLNWIICLLKQRNLILNLYAWNCNFNDSICIDNAQTSFMNLWLKKLLYNICESRLTLLIYNSWICKLNKLIYSSINLYSQYLYIIHEFVELQNFYTILLIHVDNMRA